MDNITISLSKSDAQLLRLLLNRMRFDDYLKLSDGDGNQDQAYDFIDAARNLRQALDAE